MTDERDKSGVLEKSSARTTARDVPFVRDAGSDAEPAPRGQRPEQLPRDPTYEAELAQVELAVLRNPERRDDPSTKQGGRRGYPAPTLEAPESVTPESPGTRLSRESLPSASGHPPSSNGRSAASGTLLSMGGVDPRAKTERTLETPRMFFSQTDAGGEVYFKPGKIPAVTVHQTLETETVKLADSIDPRRAKTIPRMDRQALARYVEEERGEESAAPSVLAGPGSSLDFAGEPPSLPFEAAEDYDPASSLGEVEAGQIHASLSPFRDQAEPSYAFDGVPTRAEPLAARRAGELPPSLGPDPSAVPTQRDLPMHRLEASLPSPPLVPSIASPSDPNPGLVTAHAVAASAAPSGDDEPVELGPFVRKPLWLNLAAFGVALALTIILGLWLTRSPAAPPLSERASPAAAPAREAEPRLPITSQAREAPAREAKPAETPPAETPAETPPANPVGSLFRQQPQAVRAEVPRALAPSTNAPRQASSASSETSASSGTSASSPSSSSSRKPTTTKVTRETIF